MQILCLPEKIYSLEYKYYTHCQIQQKTAQFFWYWLISQITTFHRNHSKEAGFRNSLCHKNARKQICDPLRHKIMFHTHVRVKYRAELLLSTKWHRWVENDVSYHGNCSTHLYHLFKIHNTVLTYLLTMIFMAHFLQSPVDFF